MSASATQGGHNKPDAASVAKSSAPSCLRCSITPFMILHGLYEYALRFKFKLAATLNGSRPGVQFASLIMTSLMTS